MEKRLYSIGEVSKIFDVSTDNLRFYANIGLIQPDLIKPNGYRYYCIDQFELIGTILYLRSIDTPIPEIKKMLHSRDLSDFRAGLVRQERELERRIAHLQRMRRSLDVLYETSRRFEEAQVSLEDEPCLWTVTQEFDGRDIVLDPARVSSVYHRVKRSWLKTAHIISVLSREAVCAGAFHEYNKYGLISEMPYPVKSSAVVRFDPGPYVVSYARVLTHNHREIDGVYTRMLSFVEENDLAVTGDVFERNLVDLYTEDEERTVHYLKVYMPVKKVA